MNLKRFVRFECPTCGAHFDRDKYVKHWEGESEAALEIQLIITLDRLGLRCIPCGKGVREFVTVWGDP